MNTTKTLYIAILSLVFGSLFAFPVRGLALDTGLSIERDSDAPIENRFVVGPAKIEAEVSAGDTKTVFLDLENRTGRTENFEISFEDFSAAKNGDAGVELLGNAVSDTSLKSSLYVPQKSITLAHGDRVRLPVTISIPVGARSGGKFASVVVSATVMQSTAAQTGATVVGRLGTLLFVTVPGAITHDAIVEGFTIAKNTRVFFGTPAVMNIAVTNRGNTYENPYGGITLRNVMGRVVSKTAIDPWFVLPGSTRNREVTLSTAGLFGIYRATLELNRGYQDVVDTKEVIFVALSPLTLSLALLVMVALGVFGYQKMKRKNPVL